MTFTVVEAVLTALLLCGLVNSYTISDTAGNGRVFDGIGAISGGSATSKLLVNYPQPERNQILDFLFKPNFGASLQILKVEIGGDSQASDGTESSHMHEPWDENYQRGYEWWLMTEAKKRNPNIKLYGLPWSFPGWLGDTRGQPYRNVSATAMYVINWILGAKKHYNLTIDYIGIWNEHPYDIAYVETLKRALRDNGLSSVQVVASDGSWDITSDILTNWRFAAAVDIIGCHYPGTLTTSAALKTKKRLWSSEDYSTFNDDVGAGCWARILNQNYVNGYMTSTIAWNLVAGYYSHLPLWNRQSLMTAQEPWSGHYVVNSPVWITAHTTQFTDIGWIYLKHSHGVDKLTGGGSFVTLASPDHKHFTLIIETMSHDHSVCIRPSLPAYTVVAQQAVFHLAGRLLDITELYVWRSQLRFTHSPSVLFQQLTPIKPVNGTFTIELGVDEIYTLTTLSTGHKGSYQPPPPSKPFPLPYFDDFEIYAEYSEMYNFAGQNGVFEVRQTIDEVHSKVNRQVVLHDPVYWCKSQGPTVNLGGDATWRELSVSVDMYVPSVNGTDGTFLAVRAGPGGCQVSQYYGIFFTIFPANSSFVVSSDIMRRNVLIDGTLKDTLQLDAWFTTQLFILRSTAYGFVNSDAVFEVTVPANVTEGFVAYGTTSYGYADFDNLFIDDNQSHSFQLHLKSLKA